MRNYLVLSLCSLAILTGCHRVTDADKEAALATVRKNVEAMQREDVPAVLATVHPESPVYKITEDTVHDIADRFDMHYEVHSLKVVVATPKEIKVAFDQTMRKVGGTDDFPDNRTTGIHLLRKHGEEWKLWNTPKETCKTVFLKAPKADDEEEEDEDADAPVPPGPDAPAAAAPGSAAPAGKK